MAIIPINSPHPILQSFSPEFLLFANMSPIVTIFCFLIPILLLLFRRRTSRRKLPPGSLGIPVIGHSLGLRWAMQANTAEEWIRKRISKYGPISKCSLFGKPTVLIHGQAANKFVFTSDSTILDNRQTKSVTMILGDRCLLDLSGEDHKRVRNALVSFLKPESLKDYVGQLDEEVRKHIELHWLGKQQVKVLPLMKMLTFNIMCTLLVGVERGPRRDKLLTGFQEMVAGIWSVPLNLPFTQFNRSLKASKKVQIIVKELIQEKRMELEHKGASPRQDLITCLLSIRDKDGKQVISDKEIVHNAMLIMVAGYDTSSVLITFLMRLLSNDPAIYDAILQEQMEIAKSKSEGEHLTWEDLAKMKYTWKAAQETLRVTPPIFGGFRRTLKDIEYNGYLIPKGWQIFWVTSMTHMDESIFREPSKFDPKRFENPASIPPYSFVAFGGGPRICPGYEFAKIETLVTIHFLVTRFKWKKLLSTNNFRRDPMPTPAQGLPIQISPRKLHRKE